MAKIWKQYSGIWTPTQQMQAVGASNWPGVVQYNLYTWGGDQSYGTLGLGTASVNQSSPTQVGTTGGWSNASMGRYTACAVKSDGTLWAWGANTNGQLGQNSTVNYSSPVQVGALTTWSIARSGSSFIAAIKNDGTLWMWGRNNYGQLGISDQVDRSSPVQVGGLTTWASIAVPEGYTTYGENVAGILTNGTMWAWGKNDLGQLGLGDQNNRSSPTQVGALTTWSKVAVYGAGASGAIKTDGTLWMWGRNNYGQLGDGTAVARSSPIQVGALNTWMQLNLGYATAAALRTDNSAWGWGYNTYGNLCNNATANISSPIQIAGSWDWTWQGVQQFYGIKTDGTLWACGWDGYGVLGQNTVNQNKSSPVQVGTETDWQEIRGCYGAIAIKQDAIT